MVPKWPWFLVEVAVKASGDLATLPLIEDQAKLRGAKEPNSGPAYPMPPPPTPHRDLTGGKGEEGVGGGTYLADPGGGSCWKDL